MGPEHKAENSILMQDEGLVSLDAGKFEIYILPANGLQLCSSLRALWSSRLAGYKSGEAVGQIIAMWNQRAAKNGPC